MDEFLHFPSGVVDASSRASESGHRDLDLVVNEDPADVALPVPLSTLAIVPFFVLDPPLSPRCLASQAPTLVGSCLRLELLHAGLSSRVSRGRRLLAFYKSDSRAVIFIVDDFHSGIFPKVGNKSAKVPVHSSSLLPKICGLLGLMQKRNLAEGCGTIPSKTWQKRAVGNSMSTVVDDAVYLNVDLGTRRFPDPLMGWRLVIYPDCMSDDVILDILSLPHRIFSGCFRCKLGNVLSTDRHSRSPQFAQPGRALRF